MANLKLIEKLAYIKRGTSFLDISAATCIPVHKIDKLVYEGDGTIEDLEKISAFLQVNPIIFFLSEDNITISPDKKKHNSDYQSALQQLKSIATRMSNIFKNYDEGITFINETYDLRQKK